MTTKIEIAPGVWVVAIAEEPEGVCEKCGEEGELRPYGKRMESGRRQNICYECAMKDKPTVDAAITELLSP